MTISLTRTTGVNPVGIAAKVSGMTDAEIMAAEFAWDWQEDYNFNVIPANSWVPRSSRYSFGPNAVHTYRTAGTYTVNCVVYTGGAVYSLPGVSVTISDADTVYSGANTFYWSDDYADAAAFKAAATGLGIPNDLPDANYLTGTLAAAVTAATNKRLLLIGGATYTTGQIDIISTNQPKIISTHSGIATLTTPSTATPTADFRMWLMNGNLAATKINDLAISNLKILGDYDPVDPPNKTTDGAMVGFEFLSAETEHAEFVTLDNMEFDGISAAAVFRANNSVISDVKVLNTRSFAFAAVSGQNGGIVGAYIKQPINTKRPTDGSGVKEPNTNDTNGSDANLVSHGGVYRESNVKHWTRAQVWSEVAGGWAGEQPPFRLHTEQSIGDNGTVDRCRLQGGDTQMSVLPKNAAADSPTRELGYVFVHGTVFEKSYKSNAHITLANGNVRVKNSLFLCREIGVNAIGGNVKVIGAVQNYYLPNGTPADLGDIILQNCTFYSRTNRSGIDYTVHDRSTFTRGAGATGTALGSLNLAAVENPVYDLIDNFDNVASYPASTNLLAYGIPDTDSDAVGAASSGTVLGFTGAVRSDPDKGAFEAGVGAPDAPTYVAIVPPTLTPSFLLTPVPGDRVGTEYTVAQLVDVAIADAGTPAIVGAPPVDQEFVSETASGSTEFTGEFVAGSTYYAAGITRDQHPEGFTSAYSAGLTMASDGAFGSGRNSVRFEAGSVISFGALDNTGPIGTFQTAEFFFAAAVAGPDNTFFNILGSGGAGPIRLRKLADNTIRLDVPHVSNGNEFSGTTSSTHTGVMCIMLNIDLTQATAADRVKLWVNGSSVTWSGTPTITLTTSDTIGPRTICYNGQYDLPSTTAGNNSETQVNRWMLATCEAVTDLGAADDVLFNSGHTGVLNLATDGEFTANGQTVTPQLFYVGRASNFSSGVNAGSGGSGSGLSVGTISDVA